MAEGEQTKTCPLCSETIRAAAKLCPHCRHWQSKWSLQNPQVVGVFWVLLAFGGIFSLIVFAEKTFGPKRDFAEYQDQIAIVSSQFSHRMVGSNLMMTIIGIVTNRSDFAWKNVGLETQFFDSNGQLIDVVVQTGDYSGFAILRHSEEAFRVEGKATKPKESYVSHRVTVRWAKDAGAWP